MSAFTDPEREFLASARLARIATASPSGLPDVSPVTFGLDGDVIVTGGFDITKTVRYKHLLANPRSTIVIDELVSVDPWTPRGVKVRGAAELVEDDGRWSIRITPDDDGSRVDMRSSSRYFEHDFGSNAARISAFASDLNDAADNAKPEKKIFAPAKQQPQPKGTKRR